MNITRAKNMAKRLMTDHSLTGWCFFFGSEGQEGAMTWHDHKVIEFSKIYFKRNNTRWCKDTILHEIAHALVGYHCGHRSVWQSVCLQIGADPQEFMDDSSIKSVHPKFKKSNNPDRKLKLPKIKSKIIYI